MSEWFQAKVKFLAQQDNGLIKQSTELYLIDAVSFTDAETRAFKEAGDNRDVQAVSIARSPIKEVVFYGDTDLWHKVKVCYSLMDEATEKEKKVTTYFLVNANDVKQAYERTEEHLKTMLVPFTIPKVEESPICEVFQYERPESVGPQNSAGAYYDLELTEDQKEILRQRACYAETAPDSELFTGTPILQLPQIEINRMRKLLKQFHEFGLSKKAAPAGYVKIERTDWPVGGPHSEEECAMEGDSVEVEYTIPPTEYVTNTKAKAIDPTDGQAVAFQATLVAYMEMIRPHQWGKYTTEIEKMYRTNPNALDTYLFINGFTVDESEHIYDLLANDAAFEQDEERADTDLESRLDAAMKGGGDD